jgi:hypothetical protein
LVYERKKIAIAERERKRMDGNERTKTKGKTDGTTVKNMAGRQASDGKGKESKTGET